MLARLLPKITGNSRGTVSHPSQPDPYLQRLLHLLADLGADAEQTREALDIYSHRPAGPPAQPALPIPITANNCVVPTEHVSVGENMPKCTIPGSLHQNGHLYKRGLTPMWYGRYRRPIRLRNGTYVLKPKNDKLGEVSRMTQADAWAKLRTIIDGVQTRTTPENDMTVKEFYVGYFKPEHVDKQAKASQDQTNSVFANYILPAIGDEELRSITLAQLQ